MPRPGRPSAKKIASLERPAITAIAPWFGGNRLLAEAVGEELAGSRWVGIPFAGGMPELLCIDAPTIVVSDLHRQVINLAMVAAHEQWGPRLYRRLRRLPFHPDLLRASQTACKGIEYLGQPAVTASWEERFEAATWYFAAVWMGRSGNAGARDEFSSSTAQRWNANGGDSNTRYRSAVRSLVAWRRVLARCNFVVEDCFDFLAKITDGFGSSVYCDPPFPETGQKYKHKFGEEDHRRLAARLAAFDAVRVVCRYYDHPLVRELYPEGRWVWRRMTGRKASNAEAPEVLLLNGPSRAKATPALF